MGTTPDSLCWKDVFQWFRDFVTYRVPQPHLPLSHLLPTSSTFDPRTPGLNMMRPIEELSILRNIVNQLDTATFGDPGVLIQPVLLVQPPRSRPPLKRDIERRIASAEVLHEGLNHGIQALTKLRDKWQAHKIALLAMLSPICSLPPEIVGEIFRHTVSQNWKHLGSIMLVSKQWHELATSHRGLWSHLRVSRHQIPILHRPLSYSKDYPLHLDIEHSDINPSLVSEGVFPASLAIQERLESATLTYDAELRQNLLTSIMHSTNVGYPKLRRLGVTNPLSTRHDGILNINYPTPRLEDLALKGVMARFFPSNRPRGVTRLLVSSVACSIRDLAGLLNISPHLKSIHFSSLKLSGIRHSPPPAIPALLSSLRTLTITQSELSNLAAVLQRFQAPNLESMTLDFENVIRPENADHISALRSFVSVFFSLRLIVSVDWYSGSLP